MSGQPGYPLVCWCGVGCQDWDDFWQHQDVAHQFYIPSGASGAIHGPRLPRWYTVPKARHSRGEPVPLKELDAFYRRHGNRRK